MNTERAKEIINSKDVIQIWHDSSEVWLENVEGSYAEVKDLSSNRIKRVPVNELNEV